MKKKKVLQLIDGLNIGGAEVLLIDLVRGIKEAGHDVIVGYSTHGPLEKNLLDLEIPIKHLPRLGRIDPVLLLKMIQLILSEKPDIVHTHLFKSDFHGRLAARLCCVPVVVSTSHNNDIWAKRFPLGYLYGLNANLADRIIAVSTEVREYQIEFTGISTDKIVVIENGVNIQRFASKKDAGLSLRNEFKIAQDAPLIGIIGRLQPQKDHSNFLKAAALIKDKVPNARFMIVGDGLLRDQLLAQTNMLNLKDSVIFCGIRRDIPSVMASFDVLVISSKWEGLPVTLLEGMAAYKPIVSTAVGGIPGVVSDRESGLLVPSEDSFALANACLNLLQNPVLTRSLTSVAFDRVKKEFSLDTMIGKILKLYEELLEKDETYTRA